MELLPILIFPLLLVIAGLYDLTTMTIPNWISGILVVSYFVLGSAFGLSLHEIGLSSANAFGVLILGMVGFSFRLFGGGDAKLMAAASLWFGWPTAWVFIVMTMVIGGGIALLLITFRKVALPNTVMEVSWIERLHRGGEPLPYGTAIATAGLVVMSEAPLTALLF
jgi:prepilin peptidase CpaA